MFLSLICLLYVSYLCLRQCRSHFFCTHSIRLHLPGRRCQVRGGEDIIITQVTTCLLTQVQVSRQLNYPFQTRLSVAPCPLAIQSPTPISILTRDGAKSIDIVQPAQLARKAVFQGLPCLSLSLPLFPLFLPKPRADEKRTRVTILFHLLTYQPAPDGFSVGLLEKGREAPSIR